MFRLRIFMLELGFSSYGFSVKRESTIIRTKQARGEMKLSKIARLLRLTYNRGK
jgi:hypothetical protein